MRLFGFGRKRHAADAAKPDPRVPDGVRVYAIGDVHGRFDLLTDLLRQIEADTAARGDAATQVVMLGDLIDRGPQSRQVIELFVDHRPAFAHFHFLMGNHEEMLLRLAEDPDAPGMDKFLRFGGRELLESYDVPQHMLDLPDLYAHRDLIGHIPGAHLRFLSAAQQAVRFGDYLFVHAGIRPGIPIDEQSASDLRWIRAEFLDSDADHGVVVVHGHTVTATPDVRPNRIGIDTGAYASGMLTALCLDGTDRWWLSTAGDA
jgi:serine/threonine protein phosphatase 1